MHALTYRNHHVESGLPLVAMAQAFQSAGDTDPSATTDSVATHMLLYWHPSMGPGQVVVETEDGTRQAFPMPYRPQGGEGQPEALLIAPPCVARLIPDQGEGLTIQMSPSGAYTSTSGADADPEPVIPDEPGQSELQRQARAWLRNGRVGTSAYALCATLTGVEDPHQDAPGANSVPRDPADFKRCLAFFSGRSPGAPIAGRHA